MATGSAIHIGLNRVDPAAYGGWDGELYACENDATAMQEVTSGAGFDTEVFLTADATADAVFGAIGQAATNLFAGDICVITYAGHGGQFEDLGGEEDDAKDETWLLYDREVLDDEIHEALGAFRSQVRVVVLSDSCHSGTVIRTYYRALIEESVTVTRSYARIAPKLRSRKRTRANAALRLRGAPPEVQKAVLAANRALYEGIRARTPKRSQVSFEASAILISGCQDNQESAEQNGHGAFTAALLEAWDGGGFTGDYPALHTAVVDALPPTQTPNYVTEGLAWSEFEQQVPFTIEPPGMSGEQPEPVEEPEVPEEPTPAGGTPSVSGPSDPVSRADAAPNFTVDTAGNPYYIFEICADPDLFMADREDERSESTWYSSWDDPEAPVRLEGELYWLPEYAWEALRDNDKLWFRVGTTPEEDSWEGYQVSTADDDGDNAPTLEILSTSDRQVWRARKAMPVG